MKLQWLFLLSGVAACATTGTSAHDDSPDASTLPSDVVDAGDPDGASDDAEAAPCTDCEFFPETCSADTLCPNGPFGPAVAGGGFDLRTQINVIRGRSSNDVWAAGALGALAHFDGSAWTASDPGNHETLRTLWLRDGAEVSFGVFERIYARGADLPQADAGPSSGGWSVHTPVTPPTYRSTDLQPVSGWAAPGATWLWCTARAWRPGWTTGLWRMRVSPTPTFELGYGASPQACATLPCSQMTSVHGATADTVWAVGFGGSAFRITNADGDAPNIEAFNARTWNSLLGVWSASDEEAWAVGAMGTIRHYTGQPVLWDEVSDVPTTEDLNAVWGSSASDIWAVGNAGVVVHYDGKIWSRVKVAGLGKRRPDLTTVWVSSDGHVWIGGQGVVLSLGGKP
ncbi:hypothetical protein AKJ09_09335 [Labilithrix luteola]|uniref:Type IV fimbrial biogenesis protein PilY1 n=1 Tax=Labilithrix luteola TaxID=1391654 RepID=A0A0K1QAG3_9BACT|nr:hypothetical protein [Labilithrix luteola]AKV02672.1 hypothetical protein AKJ09_09335 [Labilithrix luteola]